MLYAGFGVGPPVGGAYACPGPIGPMGAIPPVPGFGPMGAIPPFNPAFGTFGAIPPIPGFGPMGAIPPFNPYFGTFGGYPGICAVPAGICPGCI